MKRFLAILLSLAMSATGIAVVNADEATIVSNNKPIEWGIDGTGSVHSDTGLHGEASVMVDGIKGSAQNGAASNKAKMWYGRSTVSSDVVYLNLDLQEGYMITQIKWRSRYRDNDYANDYQNMKIYGANNADYSDKTVIYEVPADITGQDITFEISENDIAEYRYIRFEKTRNMGGQELSVYGYKSPAANANLSELAVEGYEFESAFIPETDEYTIIATGLPQNNTVNVNAVAQMEGATVSGDGEVVINGYGTTVIPITVTSPNGTIKTYKINFIAIEAIDISSQITATGSNVYSGTTKDNIVLSDANCTALFTGSVTRFNVYIQYNDTGYIQADLGKAYRLTKFDYTKSALEGGKALTITASNTPDFAECVTLGTISAISATTTSASTLLDSTNAYRYIRIEKNAGAHDFLPLSMRVYVTKEPLAVQSITNSSITTDTNVDVTFNDFLDTAMDTSTIKVSRNGKIVDTVNTVSGDKLTIAPKSAWKAGAIYKVTIPADVITGLDGRVMETAIEKYFAVNTDVIDFREFNVNNDALDIKIRNVSADPINVAVWNVAFAQGNSVNPIAEYTGTIPSQGEYAKSLTLSSNCAVYLFEDAANMKTFVSPFVCNNGATEDGEYAQSEETLTAEYTDSGIAVNGKSTSDEVSVFVTNGEAISATSVKAIALAAPSNGGYALNIALPNTFPSGEYNVWASDGTLATPDKAVNAPYVLSSTDKQNYANQIAGMDSAMLKEFFEYDSTNELDTDNSAVLNGIGIISERPSDVQSLYTAVANLTLTGTYQEIVADINEQLALAITKEKGVEYGADNYNTILGIDTTNELYKYADENSLFDEVSTLMSKEYTDATSFNANLLDGAKLAIFANAPSIAYATSFAATHSSFFNFDFSGDYATHLTDLQQQQVVQAAMSGTTADGMRTIFNNKVAEFKNLNANNNNYGGGGGGGGGGASRPTTSTNAGIPLPEIKVEEEKTTPTPTQEGFSDMSESHWAYGTVMSLVEKGIVNGTDGKFMPEDNVTREQFVKMLVLAVKAEEKGEVSFADVPSDSWCYEYVAAAKNNGIVNGVSETNFGTGLNITRQDMAVMIYNTIKSVGKTFEEAASSTFDDTEEIKDYAIHAVQQLSAAGIINGRDNNMFVPSGNATRAEAATIISRMLDLIA